MLAVNLSGASQSDSGAVFFFTDNKVVDSPYTCTKQLCQDIQSFPPRFFSTHVEQKWMCWMSVLKDIFQQVQLFSILHQLNYLADFLLSWNEFWLFIISGPSSWTEYFNSDPSMLLSYFFNFLNIYYYA